MRSKDDFGTKESRENQGAASTKARITDASKCSNTGSGDDTSNNPADNVCASGKTFIIGDQGTGDFIRYEMVRMLKKESEAMKEKLKYLVESKNSNQTQ
jgi:hypothetical protein